MANKKDLAVDILVPLSGRGGVERVINQAACFLMEQGWQVRVVQMVYDGQAWLDARVPFYPLRREKVDDIFDFIPMYAQFMGQTRVPDLVVATPWPYLALAARKALEQLQAYAKVVSWLHGPLEVYKRYEVGGAECVGFADEAFVLNERTRALLERLLPQVPARLVWNPVDFSRCREVSPGNERRLLFVGRLSPEKHVGVVLEAVAKSRGWRLRIVGSGPERAALEEQAQALGLGERVELSGWQDNPWELAEGCAGLVLASEYEAFPLVAIEAMACGLPVFSTPVDGVIELVRPGENGFLFERDNSAQLAQILDLYADGGLPRIEPEACRASAARYEAGTALERLKCALEGILDKVSVIVPCCDVSDYLPNCLNSVFEQQVNFNLEVICVDDGSTDRTQDVLMEWEARFPEELLVIPLEERGGAQKARGIALQYATGNYIVYAGAQDVFLPGELRGMYEAMRGQGLAAAEKGMCQ